MFVHDIPDVKNVTFSTCLQEFHYLNLSFVNTVSLTKLCMYLVNSMYRTVLCTHTVMPRFWTNTVCHSGTGSRVRYPRVPGVQYLQCKWLITDIAFLLNFCSSLPYFHFLWLYAMSDTVAAHMHCSSSLPNISPISHSKARLQACAEIVNVQEYYTTSGNYLRTTLHPNSGRL